MADTKPPWGSDEDFNPQKAWDLIQNLRGDLKTAKDDATATKAKLSTVESERDAALKQVTDKEEAGKSESEKLTGRFAEMEKQLADERQARIRAEVASAKGLSPAQAKRLAGTTKEELEADADEILEAFPTPSGGGGGGKEQATSGPPNQRPAADLQGGSNPAEVEEKVDIAKLADAIPRP
jgi:polyhydroxyalkanoate synthesis regulator phasin